MARLHRMTPKRKAALRKAQLASARKRRRRIARNVAIGAGVVGAVALTPALVSEYKWHAGRGASRRHFAEANQRVLSQYQRGKTMSPRSRGDYQGYRYARARKRYASLQGRQAPHGVIHRMGLSHGPSPKQRGRAQIRRNQSAGHRIRNVYA